MQQRSCTWPKIFAMEAAEPEDLVKATSLGFFRMPEEHGRNWRRALDGQGYQSTCRRYPQARYAISCRKGNIRLGHEVTMICNEPLWGGCVELRRHPMEVSRIRDIYQRSLRRVASGQTQKLGDDAFLDFGRLENGELKRV